MLGLYATTDGIYLIINAAGDALFNFLPLFLGYTAAKKFNLKPMLGLAIGALGGNEQVVISQGMNPSSLKLIGLGLSNGLIALSGGMLAQYQGFADANLGQGMVVQGLAAIMLGEFLFSSNRISLITLRAIFGAIIYKALMFFGRRYGYLIGITPNDFKLLTGILVIISLAIAKTRSAASDAGAKKKAMLRTQQKGEENA